MILIVADGSRGHYRVDEDGRVYTCHHFDTREHPGLTHRRLGPAPGERPDPKKYTQYAASTPFWLPTGQVEQLGDETRADLEEAQERLELHWLRVEAREFVLCPECGKPAPRDYRLELDGRVPFVCEDRHICVDETETPRPPRPSGEDPVVAIETESLARRPG